MWTHHRIGWTLIGGVFVDPSQRQHPIRSGLHLVVDTTVATMISKYIQITVCSWSPVEVTSMSTTFAARLNRLFDTVYPPGRGPHTWFVPYTTETAVVDKPSLSMST